MEIFDIIQFVWFLITKIIFFMGSLFFTIVLFLSIVFSVIFFFLSILFSLIQVIGFFFALYSMNIFYRLVEKKIIQVSCLKEDPFIFNLVLYGATLFYFLVILSLILSQNLFISTISFVMLIFFTKKIKKGF